MSNPIIPNWVPGQGQLATKRIEYEGHITGAIDRHTADQIDLTSPLLGATTVEQALITISGDLNPVVPQATTSTFGIIQLGGDLSGVNTSAATPVVSGLQGKSVSSLNPTNGQYLKYVTSQWVPSTFTFSSAGDVSIIGGAPAVISIGSISHTSVPITAPLSLTNTLTLGTSGAITTGSSSGTITVNNPGGLTLAAGGDFVQYSTAHTRTIWNTFTVLNIANSSFTSSWQPELHFAYVSLNVVDNTGISFKLDNLHNGATITSLSISFAVADPHSSGLPETLPFVFLNRVNLANNSSTSAVLSYTGGSPTPGGSQSVYYNSGLPQIFTSTFLGDAGDNIIDTSNYVYFAEVADESGTRAVTGNQYFGYSVTYGNITTDQFP